MSGVTFEILDETNIPLIHNPGEPTVHLPRDKKKKMGTVPLVLVKTQPIA